MVQCLLDKVRLFAKIKPTLLLGKQALLPFNLEDKNNQKRVKPTLFSPFPFTFSP